VVLYTRVSTDRQAEQGTSLAGQQKICRKKALDLGLPLIAEYEDAGVSGADFLSRCGIQQALSDIGAGRADTLMCANMSRSIRDREHQAAMRKMIAAAGGRLVLCDMTFGDTPS
jgi:site-specific DNA recombinase